MQKVKFIKKLEDAALDYERGSMMRADSEVEIDITDGEVLLCDYSESRGSAEVVKTICNEDDIDTGEVKALCNKHSWAYCID